MERMRLSLLGTLLVTGLLQAGPSSARAAVPVGCAEPPRTCGIVSPLQPRGCPAQWHTQPIVASAGACGVVIKNDSSFGDYQVCARMYRNLEQFAELKFARQFGTEVFSQGSCPAPSSYPSCSPIRALNQGSFCRCPAGSRFPVAGCAPNGSGTVCMTSSVAAEQCQ